MNLKNSNDNFFEKVYQVVRLIPLGRVTSYGAIAAYLGSKGSSRMVGWAMNASHSRSHSHSHSHSVFIPAHRVVNRNGMLTGKHHFGGANTMRELLESEGVKIVDDQIIDFTSIFWDPSKELKL